MKALKKFLDMFCTAGTLLFLGLDVGSATPKQMSMITGAMCGVINMVSYWLDGN